MQFFNKKTQEPQLTDAQWVNLNIRLDAINKQMYVINNSITLSVEVKRKHLVKLQKWKNSLTNQLLDYYVSPKDVA